MAAVSGVKYAKYISSILEELVFSRKGPTKLFCDNIAERIMEHYKKPTERARKIYVQKFALQECVDLKQVLIEHIRTHLNLYDTSTKALGWVLQNRHTVRMMVEYGYTSMHIEYMHTMILG